MTHHLELVERGEIRRFVIALPPRHLKSLCASVAFPAWILALLSRPKGARINKLQKATGWQAHSIRGFMTLPSGL